MAMTVIKFTVSGKTKKEIENKAVNELTKLLGYIPNRQEIYYEINGWLTSTVYSEEIKIWKADSEIKIWKADIQYAI